MPDFPTRILSRDEIKSLEHDIMAEAQAGRPDDAWRQVQPLRKAQHHQHEAAWSLLRIIHRHCLPRERAADVAADIAQSHQHDADILAALGECLEAVREAGG
jgi:hypothetical protein